MSFIDFLNSKTSPGKNFRGESKYSNKTLPILLKDQKILLIGGGKVAYQKARVLKSNNIDFEIVADSIIEEIKSLGVSYKLKKFEMSDLKDFNIVIDATGNKDVNHQVKKIKKSRFFLLNSVDIPEECDFYFSSLLSYKNLKIAISSDGGSPTLTQVVREKIKEIIPSEIGELAEKKLLQRSKNIIDVESTKKETNELFGKVFLVGCGPGDPDLITIKALKIIQTADIILHDNLVTDEILDFAKSNALIFCVGKQQGKHKFKQEETNNIMLQYAKAGYKVARLKGGDPYIFGRGAEEAEFLINNKINIEVIPGVSSAFAAPICAGIPPTCREYSSSVSIVSGYRKDGNEEIDWIDFLKLENHTTIVLMGLTKIKEIFKAGTERNVNLELPVAIISNASQKNEKIIISKFGNIIQTAAEAEKPAVLVFGNCVAFHKKLYKCKGAENYHENLSYSLDN